MEVDAFAFPFFLTKAGSVKERFVIDKVQNSLYDLEDSLLCPLSFPASFSLILYLTPQTTFISPKS